MSKRKIILNNEGIYHIFSRSIAKFEIFRNVEEYERMLDLISYYRLKEIHLRFSRFKKLESKEEFYKKKIKQAQMQVQVIAYCIMPTHIHLVLKQLKDNGISVYIGNILNSYTKYFNKKNSRKGPLWEGRFCNVEVNTDEQLIHLTRYIHLNPTTARLVNKAEKWQYSSFNEYLNNKASDEKICEYADLIDIKQDEYREFVSSNIDYQRELAKLKDLLFD